MERKAKQLTDRVISTALLYATDEKAEIEKSALRLVELCGGDRVALDSAHRLAVARAGDEPRDAINRRAVSITRRAVECGGAC